VPKELLHPLATFRPTIRHICRVVLSLFAGVSVLGTVINLLKRRPLSFTARGLLAAAIVFAALVPFLAALVWPLGVTIYAHGIRGRTKWGPRAFIPWSAVSEVGTHNASGVVFVIIQAQGGGPAIWTLPDVLENPELQRLVSGIAGPTNPILIGSTLSA